MEKQKSYIAPEDARVIYDDINWSLSKEENGLVDGNGNQLLGGSYVPVEKMNTDTTELLKQIAIPRTERPVDYTYKPDNERWYIESITWNIKEEIASKYDVKIEIEQGSLYYRGTWLEIIAKSPSKKRQELSKILETFCSDYGFNQKKEISVVTGYDLPWTEDQKKREDEDNRTDFFFDSMDD